jgi:hypothetical protein
MTPPSHRSAYVRACLLIVIAGLPLTGCGSASPAGPTPVTLLDTTVTLMQGVTCNIGYVGAEFAGEAGKAVHTVRA